VKGNVSIKKISKHMYRITFRKIGKFLVYQVWDKDNTVNKYEVNNNDQRHADYMFAKTWVEMFRQINEFKNINDKLVFTPTTIMETEDYEKYAFVIKNAYMNSNSNVVFIVSTKEISLKNNTSKKLIKLPCRKLNNVRFDIDADTENDDGWGEPLVYNVSDCGENNIRMYCCGGTGRGSFCGEWLDKDKIYIMRNAFPNPLPSSNDCKREGFKGMLPPPVNYNWALTDFGGLYGENYHYIIPPTKVTLSNNNYSRIYVTNDNMFWDPDLIYDKNQQQPLGGFMVYTFYVNNNNNNTETEITIDGVDNEYSIHFLCIGGGAGAAASNNSGGGGAGGFRTSYKTSTGKSGGGAPYEEPIKFKNKTTYKITVGNGSEGIVGDGRTFFLYPYGSPPGYDLVTPRTVKQGFPSSITGPDVNIISYGGSPGCCNKPSATKPDDYINKDDTQNQQMAGCGGGSTDNNFGKGEKGQGYDGGKGSDDGLIGGGGGGAGGKGVDGGADQSIAGNGGDGIGSDISGTYTLYAAGGSGSSSRPNYPLKLLGGTADPKPINDISSSPSRPGGNGGGNLPDGFNPNSPYLPPNFSTDIFNNGAEGRSNTGSGGGAGCKGSTDNSPGEYGRAYGGYGGSGVVILRIPIYPSNFCNW
jgi:hypothetical protein